MPLLCVGPLLLLTLGGVHISRRCATVGASSAAAALMLRPPRTALAEGPPSDATSLATFVESTAAVAPEAKLPISLALRPDYGIESPDVSYPPWTLGRWIARSTLKAVYAPAGEEVFAPGQNGTAALQKARREVSEPPLEYEVRWRRNGAAAAADDQQQVVVDREFNVASISRASMGPSAVQNVEADGPDHLTLVLRPAGAPKGSLFAADLRVVSRRTDTYPPVPSRPYLFVCAETVRQSVTTVAGERPEAAARPRPPLVKEIQTIVSYELDPRNPDIMRGYQRTATFLVPDTAYTGDPTLAELAASRLSRAPNGRLVAIDVRLYELEYTRQQQK